MGIFNKLFGGGHCLNALRKAVSQQRFADARHVADDIDEAGLSAEDSAELGALRQQAGDGLARLNLHEGLGFQRAGEDELAQEHLLLALDQACSPELKEEIQQALEAAPQEPAEVTAPAPAGGSCGSCGPTPMASLPEEEDGDLDFESRLDLILASYPPDLAERYRSKGDQYLQAFLLGHEGAEEEALELWQKLSPGDWDDLYHFERGALLARLGNLKESRKALQQAMSLNPDNLLVTETLIPVLVALGQSDAALGLLQEMITKGQDPAFCHAHLTTVHLQLGNFEKGLEHARQALSLGIAEPSFLVMASSLLEKTGDTAEAERLLTMLPAGGCGGGASLPLAEFWLRQQSQLGRALDTFNAACRQEPDNPRWQLRVAQTYIARNWQKQGLELLRTVIKDPRLEPELRLEGEQLLVSSKG